MSSHYFPLFAEQIAAQIGAEIKRLQRRKQLPFASSSSSCVGGSSPQHYPTQLSPLPEGGSRKDLPLFTFKQVGLVCERMLGEREQQIREQYDKVLNCKLAGENCL